MYNIEILNKMTVNITKVYNNDITLFGSFYIKKYKAKYSSLKYEVNSLFKDELFISSKGGNRVEYRCINCNELNDILVSKFLIKDSVYCSKCRETNLEKRNKQSKYITDTFINNGKIIKKDTIIKQKIKDMSIDELIKYSNICFDKESEKFINDYKTDNISFNEFEKIKDYIHKIDNIEIFNLKFKFINNIKIANHKKYTPSLHLLNDDKIITFRNIEFICENCDNTFMTSRRIKERIDNNRKIMCKGCCLSNKIFKIKNTTNILGEKITYQSKPEKIVIDFCKENNIIIKDGKKISYFLEKTRKYSIDFYLPEFDLDLEIKADHIWHKNQILNGIWDAKMEAIKNINYKLVFDYEIEEFLNSLILSK